MILILVHALHIYYTCNKQCDTYLHVLQHNYNRAVNIPTRYLPFEACYGYQPLTILMRYQSLFIPQPPHTNNMNRNMLHSLFKIVAHPFTSCNNTSRFKCSIQDCHIFPTQFQVGIKSIYISTSNVSKDNRITNSNLYIMCHTPLYKISMIMHIIYRFPKNCPFMTWLPLITSSCINLLFCKMKFRDLTQQIPSQIINPLLQNIHYYMCASYPLGSRNITLISWSVNHNSQAKSSGPLNLCLKPHSLSSLRKCVHFQLNREELMWCMRMHSLNGHPTNDATQGRFLISNTYPLRTFFYLIQQHV